MLTPVVQAAARPPTLIARIARIAQIARFLPRCSELPDYWQFLKSWQFRQCHHPITSMPIDRAVPATVLKAASGDSQLRSGIFNFAMSSTCFRVTVPTLFLFGSFDPFAKLAARLSSTEAGGVLVMNEYDRSA